jgi:hypothetical protein
MATTIKLKNGSGAPLAGDLVAGEPALDLTNKRLYTEDSGGTVIEVGTNPTSLTTGTFTSTGIDDNATSTAITIDSSENVGIGTASPDGKLNVVKGTASGTTASTSANNIVIDGTSGTETGITLFSTVASGIRFGDASGAGQGVIEYAHGTDHMRFVTNATERMRIDSSGNVGFGNSSPGARLDIQIPSYATSTTDGMIKFNDSVNTHHCNIQSYLVGGQGSDIIMGSNAYVNTSGAWTRWTSSYGGAAIRYGREGALSFLTNTSAGVVSERMRIDSSGNVTIDGSDASTSLASTAILNLKAGDANNEYSILRFATSADGSIAYIGAKATTTGAYPSSVGNLEFGVQNGASTVTAMTINNSGNVGIGTTSPSGSLHVSGTNTTIRITDTASTADYSFQATANDIRLYDNTAAAERMRIDSSGNLMVGTTVADASGITLNTAGYIKTYRGTTTAASQILFSNPNGVVGQVQTSGTATSYLTSSDVRLKENIVDAPAGNIDAIRVRSFDWKADGSHQTYGMVAQELVDVAPEAVSQGDTDDDMWAVDYSKLVPMMIKEIQDLKAEVAALKGA